MKLLLSMSIFALLATLFGCGRANRIYPDKIGKINSVLILGNSIVRHAPLEAIGWNNNWGMAASVADSDFVHVLNQKIKARHPECVVRWENIADWEANYRTFNLGRLDSFSNPDMLIVRVAENVPDSGFDKGSFIDYYQKMLDHVDPNRTAVRVVVEGLWDNKAAPAIKNYALKDMLPFIENRDLFGDTTNLAYHWTHPGIRAHPNDKGMRIIADRIWDYIGQYFPENSNKK